MSDAAPDSTSRGPSSRHARDPSRTPAPQLHRHGDVDGGGDRLDDAGGAIGVFEQVCAGARPRDLLHRAAEVDVDEVGADRLDHACGLAHRDGLGAEELDGERVLVGRHAQVAERPLVAVLDPGAELTISRAHEAGAVAASLAAEGLHADARHGREHEPRGHPTGPIRPGCTGVDHAAGNASRGG